MIILTDIKKEFRDGCKNKGTAECPCYEVIQIKMGEQK
jgi:hypothetical protein